MDKERQASLSRIMHYTFQDASLMMMALTHRSFNAQHNERLEFLGDSILSFIVAQELYQRFPKIDEGDLSRLRAQLVKESSLSSIATLMGLGDFIQLGEGELKSAGWRRPSILADTLEAMIGAIYLDAGIAHQFVLRFFEKQMNEIDPKLIQKDAKTLLQELLQSQKCDLPIYTVVSIEGEAHSQIFTIECTIKKLNIKTQGIGHSRRIAEQEAATKAYQLLLGVAS